MKIYTRLVSLRDMLKDNALNYVQLGRMIETVRSSLHMSASNHDEAWLAEDKEMIREFLDEVQPLCKKLDLRVSAALASEGVDAVNNPSAFDLFVLTIESELEQLVFLAIPIDRARYHGEDYSISGFPMSSGELRHASTCYSLGEYTASVFHSMRACEHGLRALERECGMAGDAENWHNVIDRIESHIKKIGADRKTAERDIKLQWISEAAAQFRYFKDAWRNHTMHVKFTYDEDQARRIFENSKQFIESLSGTISE